MLKCNKHEIENEKIFQAAVSWNQKKIKDFCNFSSKFY